MPTLYKRWRRWAGRHGTPLLVAASSTIFAASPALAAAALVPCHLDGFREEVLCTTVEVFEDREAASGRKISLRIAVMPASSRPKLDDPIVVLSGGPGQAATDAASFADRIFDDLRRQRDIVLVDLRGTGGSNRLSCPIDEQATAIGGEGASAGRCFDSLRDRAEPRFYTAEHAMDDLEDVRQALGYERLNLWGGSYGTRMALVYLERHGEHVRSMVLDSVAPFSNKVTLYYARDGQRALDLLIEDCAAETACQGAYPRLAETLDKVMTELAEQPVEVQMPHPRTGQPHTVRVDRATFAAHLRNFLYSRTHQSLLPFLIDRAAAGQLEPFAAAGNEFLSGVLSMMDTGMTFSVLCAGDVSRVTDEEIESATRNTFLGSVAADSWRDICANWPHAEPLSRPSGGLGEVPALLLSGRLDPVTPPSWGDELAGELPLARHVVVPGGAHIVSHEGCVPSLIRQFVEEGSADELATQCVEKITRPPFVLDAAGTTP